MTIMNRSAETYFYIHSPSSISTDTAYMRIIRLSDGYYYDQANDRFQSSPAVISVSYKDHEIWCNTNSINTINRDAWTTNEYLIELENTTTSIITKEIIIFCNEGTVITAGADTLYRIFLPRT